MMDLRVIAGLGGPLSLVGLEGLAARLAGADEQSLRRRLGRMRRMGLVETEREGPRRWWSATEHGRQRLAVHEAALERRLGISSPERIRLRPDGRYELRAAGALGGRELSRAQLEGHVPIHPEPTGPVGRLSSLAAALGRPA